MFIFLVVTCGASQEVELGLHVDGESFSPDYAAAAAAEDRELPTPPETPALWAALITRALSRMENQLAANEGESHGDVGESEESGPVGGFGGSWAAERYRAVQKAAGGRNFREEEEARRRQLEDSWRAGSRVDKAAKQAVQDGDNIILRKYQCYHP